MSLNLFFSMFDIWTFPVESSIHSLSPRCYSTQPFAENAVESSVPLFIKSQVIVDFSQINRSLHCEIQHSIANKIYR